MYSVTKRVLSTVGMDRTKLASLSLLVIAELSGMNLWFVSAAVLPDLVRETGIGNAVQALLTSAVQAGFVAGALCIAFTGIADRFDPRRVFCISAILAAIFNCTLLAVAPDSLAGIASRFFTGALLAGVYPVGMKIAVGWGVRDRGFIVALLVGALTFGKSLPYLAAYLGGADWRLVILVTSMLGAFGGIAALASALGPHHARAQAFDPRAIALAWREPRIRAAYLGYFGHMWELYAMWAWVATAAAASFAATMPETDAHSLAKTAAFLAIGLGGASCILAGAAADRIGKAEVAILAMATSGVAALLTASTFGGPVWLTFMLVVIWGIAVIPDSPQFSALVADASPPHLAGSLLTFQTAIGFGLTIFTVQMTPIAVSYAGWPMVICLLAIGPFAGIVAMLPLRRHVAPSTRS